MQPTNLGPYQLFSACTSRCMVQCTISKSVIFLEKKYSSWFLYITSTKIKMENTLWSRHSLPISLIHPRGRVVGSLSKVWVRTRQWPLYRTILHVSCSLSVRVGCGHHFPMWGCGLGGGPEIHPKWRNTLMKGKIWKDDLFHPELSAGSTWRRICLR